MPYLSPVGILGIGYLLQLGSCSLSIRPLASNEDQQIIRLRQQVKQQKHRLHELQQSLGRRAARASRGAGASKKAPQSPSNPMAPVHALSSEGRFSEAKVSLAAAQVPRDAMMTQVDEMRWQMGLQLNCSAADWLNSTADSAIFWSKDGRKLSQLLAILLAAAIVTSLGLFGFKTSLRTAVVRPPESETAALETETAAVVKAEGGDGMWRLQPHWQEGEDRSSESSSDESKVQRSVSGSNGSNASKAESGSNFLGDDFGCQGDDDGTAVAEMRAEGVLEPGEVETQELEQQPVEQPAFLPTPSPSPLLAPALPQVSGTPMVWFAGPEGPRRVLTEAELLVEPESKEEMLSLVHLIEEEKPIDEMWTATSWPWGFSKLRGSRWADEVLADEEGGQYDLPESSPARPSSWPLKEKPSRSQQRRRQRKNSKAKTAAKPAAATATAAPAMVLQLEQLLMLPPREPALMPSGFIPSVAPAPSAPVFHGEAVGVAQSPQPPEPPEPPEPKRAPRRRSRPKRGSAERPTPLPPRSGRQWRGRRSAEVEQEEKKSRRSRNSTMQEIMVIQDAPGTRFEVL